MSELKQTVKKGRKKVAVLLIFMSLLVFAAGITTAYIIAMSEKTENTFLPSKVTCEVTEDFTDGIIKKNVSVTNTGDIPAYIRVKLITYRVNDEGDRIGGTAEISDFVCGSGWFLKDGFYYYSNLVGAGQKTATDLIGDDGITLQEYNDSDGGKQVIEVAAEAIQGDPANAVQDCWKVFVDENGCLSAEEAQ